MVTATPERLLSVREVQTQMKVSRDTVIRWLRIGALHGFRLPHVYGIGAWRIPESAVAELMREGDDDARA